MVSVFSAVEEQSVAHQESLAPLSEFVLQEIVRPLYLAEGIAHSSRLKRLMTNTEIDEEAIFRELSQLKQKYQLDFFVASEHTRTQYFSTGEKLPLTPGSVEWYFNLTHQEQDVVAALGKRQEPHIYYDFKIHDGNGGFAGFLGLGKPITHFISAFERQEELHRLQLYFTDQNNDILLATDKSLLADGKRIMNLAQIPWYRALSAEQKQLPSLNNEVVKIDGLKYLIAQVNIERINWHLYLLNPLQGRQTQVLDNFILQSFYFILAILLLVWIGKALLNFVQSQILHKVPLDPLTHLPNRAYLQRNFNKLANADAPMSLLVLDIDHFKSINDTYGHSAGDKVISEVSGIIQSQLRDKDVPVRWGGEEFVVLLPGCSQEDGFAIAERIRERIMQHDVIYQKQLIKVTASLGIKSSVRPEDVESLFEPADAALYKAKGAGRNRVVAAA